MNVYTPTTLTSLTMTCSSSGTSISKHIISEPFEITFKGVDCNEKLIPKIIPFIPIISFEKASGSLKSIGDWSHFFINSD